MLIGLHSPYFGSTYGGGEKYLGVAAASIRDGVPGSQVEITGPVPADRLEYEQRLGLDLHDITLRSANRRVTPVHRLVNRLTPLRPLRNRLLSAQAGRATARYDLYLAMAYRIPVHSRARRSAILCQFPYRSREGIDEFQLVVCQSDYVRGWVRSYWDRDAVVVNPPIDVPASEPDWSLKEARILSVGRFFEGGHSKRHELMVKAFRDLCDGGLKGWRLDLAGSIHRDGPHAGYFERVARLAQGYPITLHPDIALDDLRSLYRRAAIYWHAAGAGREGEGEADPEASEHFGMTAAEAMGYGAVAIVYAAGGLPEVVSSGSDGYLWTRTEELCALTLDLVGDSNRRAAMAAEAARSARRFSRDSFAVNLLSALRPLLDEGE